MRKKVLLNFLLILFLGLIVSGCSQNNNSSKNGTEDNQPSEKTEKSDIGQKIKITINRNSLNAHLNTSSAAKAFAKELPRTLNFSDYMDMPEKVADLDHSLPTNGMPGGHQGTKGYIGYWSPDQRIVFYYGTEEYYEGIHIIGKFDSGNYQNVIKNMGNNVTVTIQKAD